MGRLSTEERHKRQKEKLLSQGEAIKETFFEKKSLKQIVCEKANEKGFSCILNSDSILMFNFTDEEKVKETEKWLLDNFGKEEPVINLADKDNPVYKKKIPFSYGFYEKERERD